MQNIETGYKPEFGLGAWFAGQNAANTEAANEEELIKSFLANQRERQMQPIDVEKAQLGLDPARYESMLAQAKSRDPNYIQEQLRGQIGQMQTQAAAGEKAQALLPMQIKSDKAELANKELETNLLTKFRKLQQAGDLAGADSLMKQLMQTPKYAQDVGLEGVKSANDLALAGANNSAAMARLDKELDNRLETAKIKPHQGNPTFASEIIANIKARREAGIINDAQMTQELADAYAASTRYDPNAGMMLGQDTEGEPGLVQAQPRTRWNPTVAGGAVVPKQQVPMKVPSAAAIAKAKAGQGSQQDFDAYFGPGAYDKYVKGK